MKILTIIFLSLIAGAGGCLSGKMYFSRAIDTGDEAKKEQKMTVFFSCIISLLVGISLFLMNRIAGSTDAWYLMSLFVVISLSGAFGGLISYFYRKATTNPVRSLSVSIIMGIGAALLVPVLLHILTSNLLGDIKKYPEKAFILSGLCLSAAISSDAFIDRIIDHVNNMGNDNNTKKN